MPNPFEKDWTKPEGHEMYETQDPTWEKQRNETFPMNDMKLNHGTSGGIAVALGKDGLPKLVDTTNWVCGSLSDEPSLSARERLLKILQEFRTIDLPPKGGGHYHPECFGILSGNHKWNIDGGGTNYPTMSEENGDLPEPDQVVEKEGN